MKFSLQEIAGALGVTHAPEIGARTVGGWSIDSRTIEAGDIFFALRGPQHDGRRFVAEVLRKGALAAVVEDADVGDADLEDLPAGSAGRILRVANTLAALQRLASWARGRWGGHIIAVTGSAGKTTTKDVIAQMLSVEMKTASSQGNLNNEIGLPLSLLRLDESARVAVVEMGMNHAGEIRGLSGIAKPDTGVVTNVGFAHIENFGSIDEIAAAKRELIEALPPGGTAVLNADDPRVARFACVHKGNVITFGEASGASVRAGNLEETPTGMRFGVDQVRFETPLQGRHNVSNILAGIAAAGIHGIPPARLVEAVRQLKPGKMRGERVQHGGITIYNDCYNANPEAARAMLDVLERTPAQKRIAVLGEMLELGASANELHREVGYYAGEHKIDVLIGVQGAASKMVEGAKEAGLTKAFFAPDAESAGELARSIALPGDAVLFKGSRGVRLERAVRVFLENENSGGPN